MPLDLSLPDRPRVAANVAAVPPPPIPVCRAWATHYDGSAGPVIDLTQAVPAWPPPSELRERLAIAAADPRLAAYGPLEGEPELRAAVADETFRLYGGDVTAADVGVTAGANVAFHLAATVLAAPGERVILPAPWFFNHQMALALRGVAAVPLPCRADDGFLPDPDRAAELIGPGVRAIVLVTPNNPTGAVMPPELLDRFAALCRARGLWLVLDETYRDFLPGAARPHRLFDRPDWRDFVVQLYSFSKAYCVPGHRMGSVVAGPAFRAELLKAVDNLQICPPRPPQAALAWAVPALRAWRAENAERITAGARAFSEAMAATPGWRIDAMGAYFAWVRVPNGAEDSRAVARRLASERGVVTLPGAVFGPGGSRHLRMAFAGLQPEVCPALAARLG
ncbi:MAG: aminotransferase [Acetobacteraceae bacterium]|nr:aminotransferase [Acetobacteraceae bacterium]